MAKKKAKSKSETLHDPSTFGARHDEAWQKSFITPIAREMKKRGVAYLLITIRDDGKAVFVIESNNDSATAG